MRLQRDIVLATMLLVAIATFTLLHAQDSQDGNSIKKHYTQKELQEDFQQLRTAIESMHPSKYVFTDKAAFDALFDRQYAKINGDMSLEEFYRIATPVVAQIGCGHARFNMPTGYWDQAEAKLLPVGIRIIEGKAYVIEHYKAASSIPQGREVISINGKSVDDIVKTMMTGISADGYNEGAKLRRLNSIFAILYSVVFGNPEQFAIEYLDNGERKTGSLAPVTINDFPGADLKKPFLDFKILGGKNVAVITIKTFSYYSERDVFYTFIDDAFAQIKEKKIGTVILDFRGNGGGDPFCTVHLLSYITNKPVPYFTGQYGETYDPFTKPGPLAEKNRFSGHLYTLIDAGCFSSTGHLSAVMKYHKIGTFIGEETGGTYTCNDNSQRFELKNTKYRINMPRKVYAVAVKGIPRNRGIIPDHTVIPSAADIINSKDIVMEYTLDLIAKSK